MTNRTESIILSLVIFVMIAGALVVASITAADESPASVPAPAPAADCGYDDMLPYELQVDAFDLMAGSVVCIHVDMAADLPSPEG